MLNRSAISSINSDLPLPGMPVTTQILFVSNEHRRSKLSCPIITPRFIPCSNRASRDCSKSETVNIPSSFISGASDKHLRRLSFPYLYRCSFASLQPSPYSSTRQRSGPNRRNSSSRNNTPLVSVSEAIKIVSLSSK